MKIFHYTTIETLALILKHKTIRFNRLDKVDDLEESMYGSGSMNMKLSKYVFVSCWTKTEQENLSLWKMYAGYDGVRIAMEEDMFVSYPNEPFNTFNSFYEKLFYWGKDYVADQYTNKVELHKVDYIDDPQQKAKDLLEYNGKEISIKTTDLGLFKRREWAVQDEYRYKIQVLPLNYDYIHSYNTEQLNSMDRMELTKANWELTPAIVKSFCDDYVIDTDYIDIQLKQDVLDRIEVKMGPLTTEADKIIVDSLLRDYPNSRVENSFFKGKIKKG